MSNYISKKNRAFVRKLAKGCCEYCQSLEAYSPQDFTMEHIIPIYLNGSDEIENLALACQGCNGFKFTKIGFEDKENDTFIPLFNPRKDIWTEHFKWNDDFTLLIPLTKIGEVTIQLLKLNRSNLINFRTALLALGKHPPLHTIDF